MADCTLDDLISGSKCFECLSEKQKQAAKVYFLAQGLNALGGTDLTDVNALREAIACILCKSQSSRNSFDVLIAQALATAGGASLDLSIAQLAEEIKCTACNMSLDELKAAETLLRCELNDYVS